MRPPWRSSESWSLRGVEGRFDPLPETAERAEAWLFVLAVGSQQVRAEGAYVCFELGAGEAFYPRSRSRRRTEALQQLGGDDPLGCVRRRELEADGQPDGCTEQIEAKPPEPAAVGTAVARAAVAGKRGAAQRLARGRTGHRSRVEQPPRRIGPELARDLASETFARAFAARRKYDAGRGEPRPWLFGIAHNLCAGTTATRNDGCGRWPNSSHDRVMLKRHGRLPRATLPPPRPEGKPASAGCDLSAPSARPSRRRRLYCVGNGQQLWLLAEQQDQLEVGEDALFPRRPVPHGATPRQRLDDSPRDNAVPSELRSRRSRPAATTPCFAL